MSAGIMNGRFGYLTLRLVDVFFAARILRGLPLRPVLLVNVLTSMLVLAVPECSCNPGTGSIPRTASYTLLKPTIPTTTVVPMVLGTENINLNCFCCDLDRGGVPTGEGLEEVACRMLPLAIFLTKLPALVIGVRLIFDQSRRITFRSNHILV